MMKVPVYQAKVDGAAAILNDGTARTRRRIQEFAASRKCSRAYDPPETQTVEIISATARRLVIKVGQWILLHGEDERMPFCVMSDETFGALFHRETQCEYETDGR